MEDKLDTILTELAAIKVQLAERKYIDETVMKNAEFINGNGKPGAKAQLEIIRTSQQRITAINSALIIALVVDIVLSLL